MGFEVERFVDYNKSFICGICEKVVEDPVELTCHHLFCRHCVENLPQKQCFVDSCKTNIEEGSITKPRWYFFDVYNELKIKCEFHPVS